mgnify:CR=1 FL=1
MVMIGIVPEHYSYELISDSGEFVINIPAKGFEREYYYLGTKSGRNHDLFLGSVEAVHCDESWLYENGNPDLTKIETL